MDKTLIRYPKFSDAFEARRNVPWTLVVPFSELRIARNNAYSEGGRIIGN